MGVAQSRAFHIFTENYLEVAKRVIGWIDIYDQSYMVAGSIPQVLIEWPVPPI